MIWKVALIALILMATCIVLINFAFNVIAQHLQQSGFMSNAIFTFTEVVEPNGDPIDDVEMPG